MDATTVLLSVLIVVASVLCGVAIWALTEAVKTARSLRVLSDDLDARIVPLIDKLDVSVDALNAELLRVDAIVTRFEEVSDRVSRLHAQCKTWRTRRSKSSQTSPTACGARGARASRHSRQRGLRKQQKRPNRQNQKKRRNLTEPAEPAVSEPRSSSADTAEAPPRKCSTQTCRTPRGGESIRSWPTT